jgi:RNA polymerase sigma-70 factor (ECF subfamily)
VTNELGLAIAALVPRLRRFGIALTGSRSDAEDLVQNACEKALRRSDQLRQHGRLDAWVFSIMRTLWVDEIRARRARHHDAVEPTDELRGDDGLAIVEDRLTLAAVRRALDALSEEHRAVLLLVCVDGLSYKETAGVLDVPVGTVMSRLARARQALHEELHARKRPPAEIVPLAPVPLAPGPLAPGPLAPAPRGTSKPPDGEVLA